MEPNQDSEKLSQNPEIASVSNGQVEQKNLITSRQPSYMRASVNMSLDKRKQKKYGFFSTIIFIMFLMAIVGTSVWIFCFDGKYMFSTFPLKKVYNDNYSLLIPFAYQQSEHVVSGSTDNYNFTSPKNSKGVVQSIAISIEAITSSKQFELTRLENLAATNYTNNKSLSNISNASNKIDKLNDNNIYIVKFDTKLDDSSVIRKIFVYTIGDKYTCNMTISFPVTEKNMSEKYVDIINSLKVN